MGMGDKVSAFGELRVQRESDNKEMNKLTLDSSKYYEENKPGRNDGEGLKPHSPECGKGSIYFRSRKEASVAEVEGTGEVVAGSPRLLKR